MNRRELVRAVLTFGAVGALARSVSAHTSVGAALTCPVDGKSFGIRETASYTTFGGYRDFAKKGAIGTLYEDMVHACPVCAFAG